MPLSLTAPPLRSRTVLAPRVPVRTTVEPISLAEANAALARLRRGEVRGAIVLAP